MISLFTSLRGVRFKTNINKHSFTLYAALHSRNTIIISLRYSTD